ncbi:hypothetical protein [Nocardia ninae]|uniref:hypothetical protein n=1 Tax=Nocardia ninae TaxID=356145 RepID=UPI0011BD7847|nr:hypothetical protein [Nocardia ninae]
MPDEYDDIRRRLSNYEKGLYFELGRAHEMGETPDKGWVKQFRIRTSEGPRVLDNAKTIGRGIEAVERKSGRINEREAGHQLDKERAAIEAGLLARSRWETVAGEKIPEKIRQQMRDLARDTKGKFQHVELSREAAVRAIEIGRSLASQQLELVRSYELQRADRARERLAKIRVIARAQERAEKFRKMEAFREAAARGRADAPRHVQAERAQQAELRAERAKTRETPETERDRITREAAEKTVREFQERLNIGPSTGKEPEKTSPGRGSPEAAKAALIEQVERDAARLAAREFPFPAPDKPREQQTVEIEERNTPELADAASVARDAADKAQAEREAADKVREAAQERAKALEQAQMHGIAPEVRDLLALGQAQPPTAAVETKPGYAPGVERGGTGQGRDPRTLGVDPRGR